MLTIQEVQALSNACNYLNYKIVTLSALSKNPYMAITYSNKRHKKNGPLRIRFYRNAEKSALIQRRLLPELLGGRPVP